MSLLSKLKSLRPQMISAAQAEYDAWTGDGDDPELGSGGPCDRIANAIGDVLAQAGIDSTDGGQDGDDHAFLIAYDEKDAYVVDIPPGVYERGGGYNWKKIPDVTFEVDDIVLEKFPRDQLDEHVTEENPPIDFKKIDLQARFDALNKNIFGGELPQIQLSFTKSKNASGMTDIKIVSKGMSISYLRMLNKVTPADATITVTAIKINSVRIYDDSEFDGILAHEMIHALVALQGYPFCHHGLQFLTMRREINEKYGMNIPLSHDLSEAGVDAKEREVGVMVLGKREGEQYEAFLMFQPKALDAFMERYDASYARSWRTSIKFYILHTKAWAAGTVKTKPDKYGVKLQWLKPSLGIDFSNAWLVREIRMQDSVASNPEPRTR
jgi:hypothetical protein